MSVEYWKIPVIIHLKKIPKHLLRRSWISVSSKPSNFQSRQRESPGTEGSVSKKARVAFGFLRFNAAFLSVSASAAQLNGGMRDRFGGGDKIGKAHPLVGSWPFLIAADVARTVLHGRNTERFLDDVAVTNIAKAPMRADDGWLPRGQSLGLRQRGDKRVVRRADHGRLVPGFFGTARGDLKHAIERRMLILDAGQEPLEIALDRRDRLPGNGAKLQDQLAFPRRVPSRALAIVMLLVNHVEGVGRKPGKLRMRHKGHPAIRDYRRQARTDPPHDFHLLLDGIDIGGARLRAVAEKQLGGRANDPHHHDPNANVGNRVVRVLHVDA